MLRWGALCARHRPFRRRTSRRRGRSRRRRLRTPRNGDPGRAAAEALAAEGWSVGLINARYAKPLDRQLILDQARGKKLVVTLEESVVTGGFGSGVLDLLEEARAADPAYRDVVVRIVGIPADRFVDHGAVGLLRKQLRLDADGIVGQIHDTLGRMKAEPGIVAGSTGAGRTEPAHRKTARD